MRTYGELTLEERVEIQQRLESLEIVCVPSGDRWGVRPARSSGNAAGSARKTHATRRRQRIDTVSGAEPSHVFRANWMPRH
jgi:hypothetical protein